MNYCSKNQAIKCNFQSIDLAITDARSNLLDSLRFASHDRAHGISIVFGGKVIAGTDGRILDTLAGSYDGLIIESFSVGVLPNYGNDSFLNALSDWISAGKLVCMATQVTHEGSDMEVYQVGKVIKEKFPILESYNMTLEASVTKTSWETGPFFHKISGKTGGKSEKFSPEWKNTTLFCCEMGRSVAAFCCNGLSFSPPVCTPRRSACFFLNALSNHGTIKTDEPRTLDFSGVRGFLVTNVCIVQRSAA